ncbi:hypothetical protein [Lactiplantibacillus plajomi]|uniref:Integral membrane protein n=1 Tax=Lactiplantibacillus plajomi TaxID=1457217 RepID=A0ABV6K717_9LACO|nr:hypothetical protein [Lactiplantibacillus plajomi]
MFITLLLLLALFLAMGIWFTYLNLKQPYMVSTDDATLTTNWRKGHQLRQTVTGANSGLRWAYWLSQASWILGAVLILVSWVSLETRLNLLLFPVQTAIWTAGILVSGLLLLLVPTLIWPSASYRYLQTHPSVAQPVAAPAFKRYRRQQLMSVIAFILFLLLSWVARAVMTSTAPVLVVQYLLLSAITAIPIVALISLISQLFYLHQSRWLRVKASDYVRFGRRYYFLNQLIAKQPTAKKTLRFVISGRILALIATLWAIWTIYRNIFAPAFSVDYSAVFPAAIAALIALVIVETIGALWPAKQYAAAKQLPADQSPFEVADQAQFDRYNGHLFHLHLSGGIVWVTIWLAVVLSYYFLT